jgi:dephospho-CoA kinase
MLKNSQRLIGLTGGIGTGKTTVCRYLTHRYHFPILDADIYAREAVGANSPILAEIFRRYGSSVKLADGSLDRHQLGEIIFNDPAEKAWLEQQIHPYVRQRFQADIQQFPDRTLVLAIPLLFEANMGDLVTEIWVVSCPKAVQIERLMERNQLTRQQAITRIESQLPLAEKIAQADVVLDNSSTLETLFKQIDNQVLGIRD